MTLSVFRSGECGVSLGQQRSDSSSNRRSVATKWAWSMRESRAWANGNESTNPFRDMFRRRGSRFDWKLHELHLFHAIGCRMEARMISFAENARHCDDPIARLSIGRLPNRWLTYFHLTLGTQYLNFCLCLHQPTCLFTTDSPRSN